MFLLYFNFQFDYYKFKVYCIYVIHICQRTVIVVYLTIKLKENALVCFDKIMFLM